MRISSIHLEVYAKVYCALHGNLYFPESIVYFPESILYFAGCAGKV